MSPFARRQWPLFRICREYISPLCEGAQSPDADKKGADAENAIRAMAEALQLVIVVGSAQHMQTYGAQRSRASWSTCQLRLAAKPGHFGIAWA